MCVTTNSQERTLDLICDEAERAGFAWVDVETAEDGTPGVKLAARGRPDVWDYYTVAADGRVTQEVRRPDGGATLNLIECSEDALRACVRRTAELLLGTEAKG